ncbi:hypothetical protein B0H14DRAFT_3784582 [Mycena olivaceomarginata]|nr:hypothetical protein B0H14DRAFT_3784582 [Mycena olivaceomarginata]
MRGTLRMVEERDDAQAPVGTNLDSFAFPLSKNQEALFKERELKHQASASRLGRKDAPSPGRVRLSIGKLSSHLARDKDTDAYARAWHHPPLHTSVNPAPPASQIGRPTCFTASPARAAPHDTLSKTSIAKGVEQDPRLEGARGALVCARAELVMRREATGRQVPRSIADRRNGRKCRAPAHRRRQTPGSQQLAPLSSRGASLHPSADVGHLDPLVSNISTWFPSSSPSVPPLPRRLTRLDIRLGDASNACRTRDPAAYQAKHPRWEFSLPSTPPTPRLPQPETGAGTSATRPSMHEGSDSESSAGAWIDPGGSAKRGGRGIRGQGGGEWLRFGLCRLWRATMTGILTTRVHPVSSTAAHITRLACASPLRHRRRPANSPPTDQLLQRAALSVTSPSPPPVVIRIRIRMPAPSPPSSSYLNLKARHPMQDSQESRRGLSHAHAGKLDTKTQRKQYARSGLAALTQPAPASSPSSMDAGIDSTRND